VVDAIEFGHTEVKKICAALNDLRAKVGKKKREVTPPEFDQKYYDQLKRKLEPNSPTRSIPRSIRRRKVTP